MNRRPLAAALAAVLASVLLVAGCGRYDDTVVPPPESGPTGPTAPVTTEPCRNDATTVASYDPDGGTRVGDAVRAIRERGQLVAGVAADTYLLGARNPDTNEIEGFDIDFVYAIASEIFDDDTPEDRVELRVITAAQRIPLLQDGTIDIVARNMTINCTRWQQVAFSAEYYHAGQKVLVGAGAGIDSIEDLEGKRICAPVGTTSIENIQQIQPEAVPVTAADNAACMVLFQNGEADGVSSDDTVLAGLAAQDPYATVLETEPLTDEPYGIGVNQDNVDLVRLINQVLVDMRDDGRWQASYDRWLKNELKVPGRQPQPLYGR